MSAPAAKDNCSSRSPIYKKKQVLKITFVNLVCFFFKKVIGLCSRFNFPNTRAISIMDAVPLEGSNAPNVQASR